MSFEHASCYHKRTANNKSIWDFMCQVRRRFDTAVVIGFMGKDGSLIINPDEDQVLEEGARIIALAPNGAWPL